MCRPKDIFEMLHGFLGEKDYEMFQIFASLDIQKRIFELSQKCVPSPSMLTNCNIRDEKMLHVISSRGSVFFFFFVQLRWKREVLEMK